MRQSRPLLTALFIASLCLPGAGTARAQAIGSVDISKYQLRAGDAVRLLVQDEPDLAGEYPVLEDGTVLFPLIGLVRVTESDFGAVVTRVRAAYAAELVGMAVVVQPLLRVRVLGEVRQPGLYLVDPTYDLGDVVAQAGGMTPSAAASRVLVKRGGRTERVDLRQATGLAAQPIEPAEEVLVPRRGWLSESVPLLIGAGASVLAAAVTALLVR